MSATLSGDFFAAAGGSLHSGEVAASVEICRTGRRFAVDIAIEGSVTVACDICLDAMQQAVEGSDRLIAMLGTAGEGIVGVDERDGILDLTWFVYELIALAVPPRHVHDEGGCDPAMTAALAAHSTRKADSVGPRWKELEKLK